MWSDPEVLQLNCPAAALPASHKVLTNWKLVKLKILDVSDHKRINIYPLTLDAGIIPMDSTGSGCHILKLWEQQLT